MDADAGLSKKVEHLLTLLITIAVVLTCIIGLHSRRGHLFHGRFLPLIRPS